MYACGWGGMVPCPVPGLCWPSSPAPQGLPGALLDAYGLVLVFQQVNAKWKRLHPYFGTWKEVGSSWASGFCHLHALSNSSRMWLTKKARREKLEGALVGLFMLFQAWMFGAEHLDFALSDFSSP